MGNVPFMKWSILDVSKRISTSRQSTGHVLPDFLNGQMTGWYYIQMWSLDASQLRMLVGDLIFCHYAGGRNDVRVKSGLTHLLKKLIADVIRLSYFWRNYDAYSFSFENHNFVGHVKCKNFRNFVVEGFDVVYCRMIRDQTVCCHIQSLVYISNAHRQDGLCLDIWFPTIRQIFFCQSFWNLYVTINRLT